MRRATVFVLLLAAAALAAPGSLASASEEERVSPSPTKVARSGATGVARPPVLASAMTARASPSTTTTAVDAATATTTAPRADDTTLSLSTDSTTTDEATLGRWWFGGYSFYGYGYGYGYNKYRYPYYNSYCNYYGGGNGYWRSFSGPGGEGSVLNGTAAQPISAATEAAKDEVAESRATTASRAATATRMTSTERASSASRQQAAAGCMEWLDATEAQLLAAPPDVAVSDDACCWPSSCALAPSVSCSADTDQPCCAPGSKRLTTGSCAR